MKHAAKRSMLAVMTGAVAMAGGCASTEEVGVDTGLVMVEVGVYGEAFDAAKDVLRAYRFELDRVDARGGVITTKASSAGGWATPWKDHASDWDGAWRDTLQDEARVVRVEFSPVNDGDSVSSAGVVVERVRVTRFGRRVDATSPKRSKRIARDPMRAGVEVEVVGRDAALESRILADILDSVGHIAQSGG